MPICRYPKDINDDLFYDPQENKVFVSINNATFLEEDHIKDHRPCSRLVLKEISKDATIIPSSSTKVVDKTSISGSVTPLSRLESASM